MSKRQKFLLSSGILSLGFIGIQLLTDQNRFWAIGILGVLASLLFVWSLWENLGRNLTLLSLILPMLFTFGVGIFWFLLPGNWFSRVPIVIFYGVGMYVLSLTMNIYLISASVKTIALVRAARGVGFVLTLVTGFLIFDAIISLKVALWLSSLLVFTFSFPLILQALWSVELEEKLKNTQILLDSFISSIVITELSIVLYFWPLTIVSGSLFLTVFLYLVLGLLQAKIEERLFISTFREHLTVGIIVAIAIFFATHWGS